LVPPAAEMSEPRLLPAPLGLIEIVALVGLASWRGQRMAERPRFMKLLSDDAP